MAVATVTIERVTWPNGRTPRIDYTNLTVDPEWWDPEWRIPAVMAEYAIREDPAAYRMFKDAADEHPELSRLVVSVDGVYALDETGHDAWASLTYAAEQAARLMVTA